MTTGPADPPQSDGIHIERAQVNTGGGDIVGGDKHVTINQGLSDEQLNAILQRIGAGETLPISIARNLLKKFDVDASGLDIAQIQSALEEKGREYHTLLNRIAHLEGDDAQTAHLRRATLASVQAGDFAAADANLTLTETAQELAALSLIYNEQMTAAALQVADAPERALPLVQLALASAENIEARELAFLGRMGEFGNDQLSQARQYWMDQCSQLRLMQAQAYARLGRWKSVRTMLDTTSKHLGDRPVLPEIQSLLDQLNTMCVMAGS
jgi:hypothetical protein